jgi:hypothetical protein
VFAATASPGTTPIARSTASRSSASTTPARAMRTGSARTSNRRRAPPQVLTSTTPDTARRMGATS